MISRLLLLLSGWMIDIAARSQSPQGRRFWKNLSNRLMDWERALARLPRVAPGSAGVNSEPSAMVVYRSTVSLAERLVTLRSTFATQFASSDWIATDEELVAPPDIARDLLKRGYSFFKVDDDGT